jgi:hypothetical protein
MRCFYVVEKAGIPAIWQSAPEHLPKLLRRKAGFSVAAAHPSETRKGALILLRQLFPGHRVAKLQSSDFPASN